MQKATTIKTPEWVAQEDVLNLLRQDLQLKLAYYESQNRIFENKYQKSFKEFESEVRVSEKKTSRNGKNLWIGKLFIVLKKRLDSVYKS